MVLAEVIDGLNELFGLFSGASEGVLNLVLVLKAIGIAAILYVAYAITMGILNYRKLNRLKNIEKKLEKLEKDFSLMGRKLDKVLKKKG